MSLTQKSDQILSEIKADLLEIGPNMREFSEQVIRQGISSYPVYIAFEEDCSLGKPFGRKEIHGLNWNYNASVIEEFIAQGVVAAAKLDEFKTAAGDPTEKACILLLTEEGANIIFVPFE